ncbi:MAG: hypothetical protein J6P03_02220 [Opitutales bacterium]|nr:hypothetical protein [Opitutales bacterium]
MVKDFGNQKLPRFKAGEPLLDQVTAERLNDICSMIEACRLQNGVGYAMNRGYGGTTLTILDREASAASPKLPLTAYKSGTGDKTIKLRIRSGTVCDIEPTINGMAISSEKAELEVAQEGAFYVFLQLEFEDRFMELPDSVSVIAQETTEHEDSQTIAYITLAKVVDGKIYNFLSGSLGAEFCSPRLLYWRV